MYDYQFEHQVTTWASLKKTKEILDLIKKYRHDLVYDQVQTNAERSARYVIRGSDKSGELIRMLTTLWVFNSETDLREVFSISSHHHMLIRDQDLDRHNATTVPRSTNTIVDGYQQCSSTMPLQCNFFISFINNYYSPYKKTLSYIRKRNFSIFVRLWLINKQVTLPVMVLLCRAKRLELYGL